MSNDTKEKQVTIKKENLKDKDINYEDLKNINRTTYMSNIGEEQRSDGGK